MEPALFKTALSQSSKLADSVYFHVLGEPTLHPNFLDYLNLLEIAGTKLNLTTNGTTIHHFEKHILNNPYIRQINFSTHAYAEFPNQSLAQNKLHQVLDFVQTALNNRPDLYINLRLWNMGDEKSKQWNQFVLSQIQNHFNTQINLDHFCSRHKSFLIKGRAYMHFDSRFKWPQESAIPLNKKETAPNNVGTCRALDTHVAILHDGRVVACCLDYSGQIELGNIATTPLSKILESPSAQEIKDGFKSNKLIHPFCQTCQFCTRFSKTR